jgi:hypothetical protein
MTYEQFWSIMIFIFFRKFLFDWRNVYRDAAGPYSKTLF